MSTTAPSCVSTALDIKDTNSPTRASTIAGSSMSDMPVNPRISANRITSGERSGLSASLAATLYSPLSQPTRSRHASQGRPRKGGNSTQATQNGRSARDHTVSAPRALLESRVRPGGIHDFSPEHGQKGLDPADVLERRFHVVLRSEERRVGKECRS